MLLAWWSCRPGDLPLAAKIDERLGLEDRLATALHCSDRADPVSQAALADGIAVASDPRTGEHLRRTWRVTVPETWWVVPVLVLAAVLTGFMGQADVLAGQDETRPQSVDGAVQPNDGMEQIMASIEAQPELKEQLSDMLEELEAEQAMETGQTPEQQQLDALKRMTELQRRLEELTSGEVAQSMESLRTSLKQLDVPEDGPASEMIKASPGATSPRPPKPWSRCRRNWPPGNCRNPSVTNLPVNWSRCRINSRNSLPIPAPWRRH